MALKRNCSAEFALRAKEHFNGKSLTRSDVYQIKNKYQLAIPSGLFTKCRIGRGQFDLDLLDGEVAPSSSVAPAPFESSEPEVVSAFNNEPSYDMAVSNSDFAQNLIPDKDTTYVSWGNYKDVKKVVDSKLFAPVFITGLSGNGKTMMIEQVCAQTKREFIRVNITIETDEDDLMGGFRLVNGETKWSDGPIPTAMKRGAVLLLDEIDLGGNRLMCLQPVLEGKPIYLKKINKVIYPAKGFTVLATANTKGKSDDTGNFIGTNVLNEAFLDRFKFTMFQNYPNKSVEKKILKRISSLYGLDEKVDTEKFIDNLTLWAHGSRKSYDDGALSEVITTRRLVNILEAYAIWGTKKKAIEMCLERFDDHTKDAYIDFYKKLDEGIDPFNNDPYEESEEEESEDDSL